MKDDRELLELAAKAAGIARSKWDYEWVRGLCHMVCRSNMWNPLTDDGDALRLAKAVGLLIEFRPLAVCVWCGRKQFPSYGGHEGVEMHHARRAIVRAAAEIGRTMP